MLYHRCACADILNIVDSSGTSAQNIVGTVTGRGFLAFTGCPAGSALQTDVHCDHCEVNSYKTSVGDTLCTPCAISNGVPMTTDGVIGATAAKQCLCPIGWYFAVASHAQWVAGSWACLPCPTGETRRALSKPNFCG